MMLMTKIPNYLISVSFVNWTPALQLSSRLRAQDLISEILQANSQPLRIYENNILNRNCLIRELQHVTSQFSIESTSKSDSGRFRIFILYTLYFTLFFIGFTSFTIWLNLMIVSTFGSNDKYFFLGVQIVNLRFII